MPRQVPQSGLFHRFALAQRHAWSVCDGHSARALLRGLLLAADAVVVRAGRDEFDLDRVALGFCAGREGLAEPALVQDARRMRAHRLGDCAACVAVFGSSPTSCVINHAAARRQKNSLAGLRRNPK